MREIKFRAWDTQSKKWLESVPPEEYMLDTDEWSTPDYGHMEESMFFYPSNPIGNTFNDRIVYQQYTGLKDINGKEIYEGDILASKVNEKPCNYIIKWSENRSSYCGFALNPVMKDPPRITYHTHDFQEWMAEGFEVIGNIFKNPNLCK